jgi:hypothetical protein
LWLRDVLEPISHDLMMSLSPLSQSSAVFVDNTNMLNSILCMIQRLAMAWWRYWYYSVMTSGVIGIDES